MRRRALVLIVLALCVAIPSALAGAAATPRLRILTVKPLVLRGDFFKPGERVRVVVQSGGRGWTKTTRATSQRAFSLSFGMVAIDRCTLLAQAFGAQGSRARTKPLGPECPQPLDLP